MVVEDLRCEYLREPLAIDTPKPRLSWILLADERDVRQTAYRIVVAANADALAAETGLLWDSRVVESDRSAHVEYGGKPLSSGQDVWWKVHVRTNTDTRGAWSAPAHWRMGLLTPEDWRGHWIAATADETPRTRSSI